jgi:hypothetical protein
VAVEFRFIGEQKDAGWRFKGCRVFLVHRNKILDPSLACRNEKYAKVTNVIVLAMYAIVECRAVLKHLIPNSVPLQVFMYRINRLVTLVNL